MALQVGSAQCPCMDVSNYFQTLSNCLTADSSPGFWTYGAGESGDCYPISYGSDACSFFDLTTDPICSSEDPAPSFCYDQWCYIDPVKCQLSSEIYYRSDLFPNAKLYYSYTTCNSTAENWSTYQTTKALENREITVTIPEIWYPAHYKVTETGEVASYSGPEYYDDSIPWKGWVIDYLQAIELLSNIGELKYTFRSGGSDRAVKTSKWTAAIHDIQSGLSCLSPSSFWVTSQRLQMSAFTTPASTDEITLWIKSPSTLSGGSLSENAEKMMLPFSNELWQVLITCVLGVSLLSIFFSNRHGERRLWWQKFRGDDWEEASYVRKTLVFLRVLLDSFIADATSAFGHTVGFDIQSSLSMKILNFGFGFFVLIAVAAYTANLAAYLTLSSVGDYLSSIEDAVAKKATLCAHPSLRSDLEQLWPTVSFVYNIEAENLYAGILEYFDAGLCEGMVMGSSDILNDVDIMSKMCEREIVSTGSLVLEKTIAFPVCSELAAGFSHWMHVAAKEGVTFESLEESRRPTPVCSLTIPKQSSTDELLALTPENFALPVLLLVLCAAVAIVVHVWKLVSHLGRNNWSERRASLHKALSMKDPSDLQFFEPSPKPQRSSLRPQEISNPMGSTECSPPANRKPLAKMTGHGEDEVDLNGMVQAVNFLEQQMNMWKASLQTHGDNEHQAVTSSKANETNDVSKAFFADSNDNTAEEQGGLNEMSQRTDETHPLTAMLGSSPVDGGRKGAKKKKRRRTAIPKLPCEHV